MSKKHKSDDKMTWCLLNNEHTCKHKECCRFCLENKKCDYRCKAYFQRDGLKCKFLIEEIIEEEVKK